MSAKEIVAKLRAMAADPSHRTQLVKEAATMPTLIMSLADSDTDIAFTALEVRVFCPKYRPQIHEQWSRDTCRSLLRSNGSFDGCSSLFGLSWVSGVHALADLLPRCVLNSFSFCYLLPEHR